MIVAEPSKDNAGLQPGEQVVTNGSLILEQMFEDRLTVEGEISSERPVDDEAFHRPERQVSIRVPYGAARPTGECTVHAGRRFPPLSSPGFRSIPPACSPISRNSGFADPADFAGPAAVVEGGAGEISRRSAASSRPGAGIRPRPKEPSAS